MPSSHVLQSDCQQQHDPRCGIDAVVRQLGAGKTEKNQHKNSPDQGLTGQRMAPQCLPAAPPSQQKWRPGHPQNGRHDHEVKPMTAMSFHRGGETLDVVLQNEALHEIFAVTPNGVGVPRQGHGQHIKPGAHIEQRFAANSPLTRHKAVDEQAGRWDQECDGPFDQQPRAHPQGQPAQCLHVFGLEVSPQVYGTEHQEHAQHRIRRGRVRHGPAAKTGDMDDGRPSASPNTPLASDESPQGQRAQPSGQSRGQSHGQLCRPQQHSTEGLQPIDTNRFVKAVQTIERGVAPIT